MKKSRKRIRIFAIVVFLLLASPIALVYATTNTWSSGYYYQYADNSMLGLTAGVSATYTSPAINNGYNVSFTDLSVAGASAVSTTITLVASNITLSSFDSSGSLTYVVTGGLGSQSFTLASKPSSVTVDGSVVAEGSGWSYSGGSLTVTGASSSVVASFAASPTSSVDSSVASSVLSSAQVMATLLALVGILGGLGVAARVAEEDSSMEDSYGFIVGYVVAIAFLVIMYLIFLGWGA